MHSFLAYGLEINDLATRDIAPLLRDLCQSGTLQTAGLSITAISSAFKNDPEGRYRVMRLLEALQRRNRIVTCRDLIGSDCNVGSVCCKTEHDSTDFFIISKLRPSVDPKQLVEIEALSAYGISDWPSILQNNDLSFDRSASKTEWENRIWHPILRHAKSVDIVDWVLGNNWTSNPSFESTLQWLADIIKPYGRIRDRRLITEIKDASNRKRLMEWCGKNGFRLVAEDKRGRHMRAFTTNQFILQVERGFGLVRNDSEVGACNVFLLTGDDAVVR